MASTVVLGEVSGQGDRNRVARIQLVQKSVGILIQGVKDIVCGIQSLQGSHRESYRQSRRIHN